MPGEVRNLTLSPDGTRGITGGTHMLLFDLVAGEQLFAFPGALGGGVSTIHVTSPDSSRVATLTFSRTAKPGGGAVWDLGTRRKVIDLELPKSMPFGGDPAGTFSPSGERLITVTSNRETSKQPEKMVVTAWDVKTGAKLSSVELPGATGRPALTAADEKAALTIVRTVRGKDVSLRLAVVDYATGKLGAELDAVPRDPAGAAYGPIVFNPQRTLFAVGGPFGKEGEPAVSVYEWHSGKLLHTFVGHTLGVSSLAFSPDGKTLASGSQDTTVLLWDLTTLPRSK